jgi:hypothetical protein
LHDFLLASFSSCACCEFIEEHPVVRIALVSGVIASIFESYVFAAFHYCLKAGKSFKSTVLLILAGTLPVASFVAERRALREFNSLK